MTLAATRYPTRKIGDFEIIAVSDGDLPANHEVAVGIDPEEAARLSGVPVGGATTIPVNAFLLKFRGKHALVDTGSSHTQGPTLGFLISRLAEIGVTPGMIDYVFVTHAHPDHTNGLLSPNGEINYPNAEIIIHEREADFWLERQTSESDNFRIKRNTDMNRRTLLPYRERLRKVRDGEVMNGVAAIGSFGHTPGHTGFLVHGGREKLIFWGDTVHIASLQVPRPDVVMVFDTDQDMARKSRVQMFERVIADDIAVAGAHVDYPGFARIVKRGGGYAMERDA